jgi:bacteriocin biosynthesis cyclodehydratase domain-containing protein
VKAFVPALLPLLDGTRSRDELVQVLGPATGPAVDLALETLASRGVVVEGPDVTSGSTAAAYGLASMLDATPAIVGERLARAVVRVVGSSPVGAEITRLLRTSGIGQAHHGRWAPSGRLDVVVVAPAAHELGEVEPWNRVANERGTRWLPVLPYNGRFAAVGPLIVPDESCCFECVLRRRGANLDYGDQFRRIEQVPLAARADPAFEACAGALAAHLVLRWIGAQDHSLPGVLYTLEARPAPAVGEHPVLRVPRCPVCSPVERLAPPLPWNQASVGEEGVAA